MAELAVSVDVWDTLLKLGEFYSKLAEVLADLLSRDRAAVQAALSRARSRVKSLRAQGSVDPGAIVEQCTAVLAQELRCAKSVVKRGVARAVAELDAGGLAYRDAVRALELLSGMEVPVVALSNVMWWPGRITSVIVEKAGLGGLLAAQVYADEVGALKPDLRMFRAAEEELREAGFNVRLVAHAGDDFREDFVGAMCAGLVGVLVDRSGHLREGSYFEGRGYIVRDLVGFLNALADAGYLRQLASRC